jgi:sec-independent protein translocase protein TatA
MPTLGAPELLLILVIVLLIFGVGRLPEVFKALGSGMREFRDAASGDKDDKDKDNQIDS